MADKQPAIHKVLNEELKVISQEMKKESLSSDSRLATLKKHADWCERLNDYIRSYESRITERDCV